jgi:uncharacterized protein
MGMVLLAGRLLGSAVGVQIFALLRRFGQVELVVSLAYVVLLGSIGGLMLNESLRALRRRNDPNARAGAAQAPPLGARAAAEDALPDLASMSAPSRPSSSGIVGVLAAIMGVGGGFIMVPAMIYLLGMPTKVVVGTSVFQFLFVTGFTTMMHAWQSQTVDMLLALILLVGGVIGAQIGVTRSPRAAGRAAARAAGAPGALGSG